MSCAYAASQCADRGWPKRPFGSQLIPRGDAASWHRYSPRITRITLTPEQAEEFYSYLTAPAVRIPLVLRFFADHPQLLRGSPCQYNSLHSDLWQVLMSPGPWQKHAAERIETAPVDEEVRGAVLGARPCALVAELLASPCVRCDHVSRVGG